MMAINGSERGTELRDKAFLQSLHFAHNVLKVSVLILFFCMLCAAYAIELPLYLNWNSVNNGFVNNAQPGKKLSWDEYYSIGLGLDSLKVNSTALSFLLTNQADFDENYLQLESIHLDYTYKSWYSSAQSTPQGYGKRNTLANRHIVNATQNKSLYRETRFNGLGIGYLLGSTLLELKWGGNKQNQSIALAKQTWNKHNNSLSIVTCQEARTQDSFWRRPVYTGAIRLLVKAKQLECYSEIAASLVPALAASETKYGVVQLLELSYRPDSCNQFFIAGDYTKPDISDFAISNVRLSYSREIGDISISPGITLNKVDSKRWASYHILGEWNIDTINSFGLFYRLEESSNKKYIHNLGLQARLSYGL